MKDKKREPWRIGIAVLSAAMILFMWSRKDVLLFYAEMPAGEIFPLVATTVAVTLLKVAGLTMVLLLVKWVVSAIHNRKNNPIGG